MERSPVPLSRSSARVLVFAGLCLLFPIFAAAQTVAGLSPDYSEMVRLYASGEHASAVAVLGGFSESRIRQHTRELSEAVVSIRKCPACPTRLAFSRFPVRAALLLHADREIQEQFSEPVSEQISRCGTGLHATIIEHLAAILLLIDPNGGDFLKPFYVGMAGQAQWSHCISQSQIWARAGLKWFARDAALLMALGVATESRAFFTMAPAPRAVDLPPSAARQHAAAVAELRDLWESARRAFEDAAAVSPDLVEARLRLGRVLWRQGKLEAARASLEAALGRPAGADSQYLAHLFLGRVLEDSRQWPEAEEHYRTALSLQPLSETAAVAVSHLRFLQGDPESARKILREGLEAQHRRTVFDPWVPYLITQTPDGERILAELRQAVRP